MLSTLELPATNPPRFTYAYPINNPNVGTTFNSGGNFLGTLDGNTPLTATYCVNIDLDISTPRTYNDATVTVDGTIYGNPVPNAGAISWLLNNIGPVATTPVQQDALQAAIWRTEYGANFELDSVDNNIAAPTINSSMRPFYQDYLSLRGNNTAPLDSVYWISPGEGGGITDNQGVVAIPDQQTSVPPPTPQVTGIGVAGQTKKGLTSFTVAFNEALNPGSAGNSAYYHVFASVKKRGKTVFSKPLSIRSVSNNGGSTVTITLAKPHKGAVQVTVDSGILAANGASSTSPSSMVIA